MLIRRKYEGEWYSFPSLQMVGELSGTRLNAWKHGELVKAEYERQNGRGTVMAQSSNGRGTVMAPNKEKRIENSARRARRPAAKK